MENLETKLLWECSEGHKFEAKLTTIIKAGHWCEECFENHTWSFDKLAKKNPFYAQVYYNSHDKNENMIYYFDKDFNIVYYRQGRGSLTVRKFLTGIMTKYRVRMGSARNDGTYTIGAVYETLFSKSEINANNYDQLNIFMGHDDMRATKGGLEVLTMNTGYDDRWQNEFGVDFYYNMNVIGENQLGQYTSKNPDDLDKFFNGTRNLSWNIWYVNFRFVFAHPYDWHLTEHINKKGWH